MKDLKILIVGGGIAGLSAMRALELQGYSPTLVEKSDTIRSDGTGILLGINAVSILTEMGHKEALENEGLELSTMSALDERGDLIAACDLEYVKSKSGSKTYAIHRESIISMLLNSVDKTKIQTGKKLSGIQNYKQAVQVSFENKDVEIYDLVIGADGIGSVVRESLYGDIKFRDAKQGCWRFVAKTPVGFDKNGIFEYFGVGKRAGYMPLKDGRLYAYVLLNSDKYDKNNLPSNEELLKNFDEFEGDWELISKAVLDSQKTVFNELKDLSTICLTKGNVALAGDAAHAVTPNLGQGAAMGIEDGYMLAKILKSSKTLDEALKKYENARYKRVKMIRDKSFMIGKLAQSASRAFCFVRNMIYRAMPSSMLAKDTLKTLSLKQKGF